MKHHILSALCALALALSLLAAAIFIPATANRVMLPLMERYAPPEATHLPAEEYAPVVSMITSYLKGGNTPFQHHFTLDGAEYAAFNQKEQQHMDDVQSLFRLCRWVLWGCGALGLMTLLARRKELPWHTFRRTLLGILGAVAAVIIAACIDFDSLFVLFHHVAFTNDLWLLDPQTDLLIRLMPIEFFISYAAIIGGVWLLGMTMMIVLSTIIINKRTEGE